MKKIYELKDILCEELDRITGEISKNKLTQAHLDLVAKLTDTIKNIDKIAMLEEGDYSSAGHWEAMLNGEYGHNDFSSRRARNRNGTFRRGSSRSDAAEETMDKLEDMMYDVDDPKTKEVIRMCMEKLRQM